MDANERHAQRNCQIKIKQLSKFSEFSWKFHFDLARFLVGPGRIYFDWDQIRSRQISAMSQPAKPTMSSNIEKIYAKKLESFRFTLNNVFENAKKFTASRAKKTPNVMTGILSRELGARKQIVKATQKNYSPRRVYDLAWKLSCKILEIDLNRHLSTIKKLELLQKLNVHLDKIKCFGQEI